MKRCPVPLLAALLFSAQAAAQDLPDHRMLTVAAVAMEEGLDPEEHAGDWLRLHMPELQAAVRAGEVEQDDAERRALETLRTLAAEFDPDEPIELRRDVFVGEYDAEEEAFPLNPFFLEHYFMAQAPAARSLPDGYLVLVANLDLVSRLPMDPEAAAAFRERRKSLHGTLRRRVYASIDLRLVAFQNGRDFQAVMERVDLFDDPERQRRLHRYEEDGAPAEVVEDRLLSGGVTWEAVENHGFEYLGIRFLTVFPEHHPALSDCESAGRKAGHGVIRCHMASDIGRIAVTQERFYVGGRLGRVVLHRTGPVEAGQRALIGKSLRRAGGPTQLPTDESLQWQYRQVHLEYRPEALGPDAGDDQTAFLVLEAAPYRALLAETGQEDATKTEGGS